MKPYVMHEYLYRKGQDFWLSGKTSAKMKYNQLQGDFYQLVKRGKKAEQQIDPIIKWMQTSVDNMIKTAPNMVNGFVDSLVCLLYPNVFLLNTDSDWLFEGCIPLE